MDARRCLSLAAAGLALAGCAAWRDMRPARAPALAMAAEIPPATTATPQPPAAARSPLLTAMAPIPNPPAPSSGEAGPGGRPGPAVAGRGAISAANLAARERSRAADFVGGVQVFAYEPGRVYEVWTAPLRVTTLTLGPGETIVSKAAGDTVRWQIGETTSGEGESRRAHVMIKPLQRGLETNLVLATSQRIYLLDLKSGAPASFNAAIAWDLGSVLPPPAKVADATAAPPAPAPVTPSGPLDAGYRIEPEGRRRPSWTPTAVLTDGARTFLRFPDDLAAHEAPALFALGSDGAAQLVNYRQQGGLWIVDRVLDRAELRLGDKPAQTVRIVRISGGRS